MAENPPRRGGSRVTKPTAAHIESARRLLAREGGGGLADERAAVAGRIHDKLVVRLAPLIGDSGVRALFARSVKVARVVFPALAEIQFATGVRPVPEPPEHQLVRCLGKCEPAVASEMAIYVYATLLTILANFIGEPLVARLLTSAFPGTDETTPKETE
jgi:hypothetical protein